MNNIYIVNWGAGIWVVRADCKLSAAEKAYFGNGVIKDHEDLEGMGIKEYGYNEDILKLESGLHECIKKLNVDGPVEILASHWG